MSEPKVQCPECGQKYGEVAELEDKLVDACAEITRKTDLLKRGLSGLDFARGSAGLTLVSVELRWEIIEELRRGDLTTTPVVP